MCGRPGWPVDRLVIAPLVLDQPIVLGCRIIEHPEGIPRRAHPRLRFTPPAQIPVPLGRLLDGQLGQRERLQPLVRNRLTAQDRSTEGPRSQTSLRPLQSAPPVTQPLAQSLAGLLSDPAASAVHLVLQPEDTTTASSWSRATARPSRSSRRRSWSNRARARALSTALLIRPNRRHHPGRTGSQNPTGTEPKHHRTQPPYCWTWPPYCLLVGQRLPVGVPSAARPTIFPHALNRVEDAGVSRPRDRRTDGQVPSSPGTRALLRAGCLLPEQERQQDEAPPGGHIRTSCRCEQLNTSAAPAAGRYSSGPYSGS